MNWLILSLGFIFLFQRQILGQGQSSIVFSPNINRLQAKIGERANFPWKYTLSNGEIMQKLLFGIWDPASLSIRQVFAVKERGSAIVTNPATPPEYAGRVIIKADDVNISEMLLRSVTANDDQKYFACEIRTTLGRSFTAKTQLVTIIVPTISSKTTSPHVTNEGSTVQLECRGLGKPLPTIEWRKVGNSSIISSNTQVNSLVFPAVRKEDAGVYRCTAWNTGGQDEYNVDMVVYYKPVIDRIKSTQRIGSYLGNQKVTQLSCVAHGRPDPQYSWRNPQGAEVSKQSTFFLQNPNSDAFGNYMCTASNAWGATTLSTQLYRAFQPGQVIAKAEDVGSRSVRFSWDLPADRGNSDVQQLLIQFYDRNVLITKSLPINGTSYILGNLRPFASYNFNFTLRNEFFSSVGYIVSITTKESAPGAIAQAEIVNLSSRGFTVQWATPTDANGELTHYVVAYDRTDTYDLQDALRIVAGLKTSVDIINLDPFTDYSVQVQANTKVGAGDWSATTTARTDLEAPSAPSNVKISVKGPSRIQLAWRGPSERNGPISKYGADFVYYENGIRKRDSRAFLPSQSTSQRSVSVDDLKAFTDYEVALREGTGTGPKWGPFTNYTKFSTPEGVPSSPRDMKILSRSLHAIDVSWKRPSQPNGNITMYKLFYENSTAMYDAAIMKDLNNETLFFGLRHLSEEIRYKLKVRAYTNAGGGVFTEQQTVYTSLGTPGSRNDANASDSFSTGPIIGGIFSFLVIMVLIILLILYIARKKRLSKKSAYNSGNGEQMKLTAANEFAHGAEPTTPSDLVASSRNGMSPHCVENGFAPGVRSFPLLRKIPSNELRSYIAKHRANKDKKFVEEFKAIKPVGNFSWDVSAKAENKAKNRYANIIAYDHSRVVLSTVDGLPGSDYINANYVDGYNQVNKFIATQGPVAASFSDFWRMVWEQNSCIVVMVTNLIEKSRIKCQKYWPTSEAQQYGNIAVAPEEELELADYSIRRFSIVMSSNKAKLEPRTVTQYQFMSWPDRGVPPYPSALLQFLRRVRSTENETNGPIIVHCSAGVGRTGTFISLYSMLDQLECEDGVDVFGYTTHMRSQRNLMIQTEMQYIFTYQVLAEAITCGNTEVSALHLSSHLADLMRTNQRSGSSFIHDEYERIVLDLLLDSQSEAGRLNSNLSKNRFASILPYDNTRVKLWPYPGVEGSDYINANFVDGYQQREAYIATQAPLENTVDDFWRMTWEYEVFSIVMLSSAEERDMHHCFPYWPINTEPASFGLLLVQIASEDDKSGYVKREFRVTNSKTGETRIVTHFMFYSWPELGCPSDSMQILEMINSLLKTQQMTGNGSICIHCSDGCGRTGSLCAIMTCIERLKLEGCVDVFQTVRTMRTQRADVVMTLDQYIFIYETVRRFVETFSNYANFK